MNFYFFSKDGVKGTYWATSSDSGGCQMPTGDYVITDALALGQSTALGDLAWKSGLCGQVLDVDCGYGVVQAIVVSTCNLGSTSCGVDMIEKTWNTATNNASPGETTCSVTLSTTNPLSGSAMQCFHRPNSDIGNAYYVILGVHNTGGKITKRATLAGVTGTRGNDGWFMFNSAGQNLFTDNAIVTFEFEDGSSQQFTIGNCKPGGQTQIFP